VEERPEPSPTQPAQGLALATHPIGIDHAISLSENLLNAPLRDRTPDPLLKTSLDYDEERYSQAGGHAGAGMERNRRKHPHVR
jgi:hypothetical protein